MDHLRAKVTLPAIPDRRQPAQRLDPVPRGYYVRWDYGYPSYRYGTRYYHDPTSANRAAAQFIRHGARVTVTADSY